MTSRAMSRQRALQSTATHPEQAQGHPNRSDLMRQFEICARFGISDETWRQWRKSDPTMPAPVSLRGRPRWRVQDIDDYMAGRSAGLRHYFPRAVGGGR